MDILIGTKNQYKATEMVSFLGINPRITIHLWEELDLAIKVEEDQLTLKKTRRKKESGYQN